MAGPRSRYDRFEPDDHVQYRTWSSGYPGGPTSKTVTGDCRATNEIQISEGHPWPPRKGNQGDIGGDFRVVRRTYSSTPTPDMVFLGSNNAAFVGKQYAYSGNVRDALWPTVTPSTKLNLEALGTTVIANVLPTNPQANLAQFIGEAREGIPSLCGTDFFKSRASLARSAGSEYLNVQFGWLPLISDLKKFAHVVQNSDALIQQYVRNSGKRIKREVHFPIEQSTSTTTSSDGATPSITLATNSSVSAYMGTSQRLSALTQKTETWFKGCFTYYLPPFKANDSNIARNEQLLNYLYGTRVTPETLWDLSPWTWAADWFGNTGDVLHNVAAFATDGLVMPYAYIMERKTAIRDVQTRQTFRQGYGTKYLRQTFTTEVKSRYKASPYGFGLTFSGFNPRQIAIMSALGLTKGSTKYRNG